MHTINNLHNKNNQATQKNVHQIGQALEDTMGFNENDPNA